TWLKAKRASRPACTLCPYAPGLLYALNQPSQCSFCVLYQTFGSSIGSSAGRPVIARLRSLGERARVRGISVAVQAKALPSAGDPVHAHLGSRYLMIRFAPLPFGGERRISSPWV